MVRRRATLHQRYQASDSRDYRRNATIATAELLLCLAEPVWPPPPGDQMIAIRIPLKKCEKALNALQRNVYWELDNAALYRMLFWISLTNGFCT